MNFNVNEIRIKVKIVEGKLKAIASLDFGDFTIKGFRIQESQYPNKAAGDRKLWLTPPSYADRGGRYHPIFYIPDKDLWERLEAKIWEAYDSEYKRHYAKVYDLEDNEADQFLSQSS